MPSVHERSENTMKKGGEPPRLPSLRAKTGFSNRSVTLDPVGDKQHEAGADDAGNDLSDQAEFGHPQKTEQERADDTAYDGPGAWTTPSQSPIPHDGSRDQADDKPDKQENERFVKVTMVVFSLCPTAK